MELLTVSSVNQMAKKIMELQIGYIAVQGEISKTTLHSSGHFYFTLKDDRSSLDAVLFKNKVYQMFSKNLSFTEVDSEKLPKLGELWICEGVLTIWEKTGRYMFKVNQAVPSGRGKLYRDFQLLKEKLYARGWLNPENKKKIPPFPLKVGVISSPTGAAIRDIIKIYTRRFPAAEIIVSPALMQGKQCVDSILQALDRIKQFPVDLIILTRGGGSPEDLAEFNDERLAQAVFHLEIPIVSAIGHEIDQTIVDLVADLSASTPSAAAELVFPDRDSVLRNLDSKKNLVRTAVFSVLEKHKKNIEHLSEVYAFRIVPDRLRELRVTVDNYREVIEKQPLRTISSLQLKLQVHRRNFQAGRILKELKIRREKLELINDKMIHNIRGKNKQWKQNCRYFGNLLGSLSPQLVLTKGYSMVTDHQDKVITRGNLLKKGKKYKIKFIDSTWLMKSEKEISNHDN
ncbi:MAG: exodeoxyribonuclease VII large subunit [bacterium]